MSYEWRKPCASRERALASASAIVSPVTNCSPISRIARSTLFLISGSPPLPTMRASELERLDSLCVATSLPVSSSAQVAALTNSDGLRPRCSCHWPVLTLSRISASRVAGSGIRSSASARHISATPSCDDSEYSWSKPCTSPSRPPPLGRSRSACARRRASACAALARAGSRRAASSNGGTTSGSGRRVAAVIARRSGVRSPASGMSSPAAITAPRGRRGGRASPRRDPRARCRPI